MPVNDADGQKQGVTGVIVVSQIDGVGSGGAQTKETVAHGNDGNVRRDVGAFAALEDEEARSWPRGDEFGSVVADLRPRQFPAKMQSIVGRMLFAVDEVAFTVTTALAVFQILRQAFGAGDKLRTIPGGIDAVQAPLVAGLGRRVGGWFPGVRNERGH